jgi:lysozyme
MSKTPISGRTKAGVIGAAVIALAAPVVMHFEGLVTKPYLDPIGIPTVCYGETHAVMRNYTPAECQALLVDSMAEHGAQIAPCLPEALPDNKKAAALSFAYNVGSGAFCGSTFARKLKAGDPTACAELSRWVLAGGKELPGLVRRRAAERALCEGRP